MAVEMARPNGQHGCEYGRMTRQMMADKQELMNIRIRAVEDDMSSVVNNVNSINNFSRNTMVSAILMLVATLLGMILK